MTAAAAQRVSCSEVMELVTHYCFSVRSHRRLLEVETTCGKHHQQQPRPPLYYDTPEYSAVENGDETNVKTKEKAINHRASNTDPGPNERESNTGQFKRAHGLVDNHPLWDIFFLVLSVPPWGVPS